MMDLHSSRAVFYCSALVSVEGIFLKTNILNLKQVHRYLFGWWILSQTLGLPWSFCWLFPASCFMMLPKNHNWLPVFFFFFSHVTLFSQQKPSCVWQRVVAGVSKWKWVKSANEDKNSLVTPGLDFRAGLGYNKLYELHYGKGSLRVLTLFGSYFRWL